MQIICWLRAYFCLNILFGRDVVRYVSTFKVAAHSTNENF